MFTLTLKGKEFWDETKEEFVVTNDYEITIEHSLVSLSKWESFYKKPFLTTEKTVPETIDYIRFMTLSEGIPEEAYNYITADEIRAVNDYINDSQTATWFSKSDDAPNREIITAEVLYYDMIALQIPMECQYWHLQRLLTLIRVCSEKNKPKKNLPRSKLIERNRALNEARRKKYNTRG